MSLFMAVSYLSLNKQKDFTSCSEYFLPHMYSDPCVNNTEIVLQIGLIGCALWLGLEKYNI